jgi:cell division transport system ATP-binding protein
MVSVIDVSKWYRAQGVRDSHSGQAYSKGQFRVLEHINLELKKGEFLYLVGGSGAGKSTLLRLLATEETPTAGSIALFGYHLKTASSSTLRAIRRVIGYIPQDIRLIHDLSVFDNVALSLSLLGHRFLSSQCRLKICDILGKLGLESKKNDLAMTLSGGEAQRVAVARALVRSPELIVADEPTGAQDRDFRWGLIDQFLKASASGTTVVLATHDREIVRRVRKKCAVLRAGKVAFEEAMCIY